MNIIVNSHFDLEKYIPRLPLETKMDFSEVSSLNFKIDIADIIQKDIIAHCEQNNIGLVNIFDYTGEQRTYKSKYDEQVTNWLAQNAGNYEILSVSFDYLGLLGYCYGYYATLSVNYEDIFRIPPQEGLLC